MQRSRPARARLSLARLLLVVGLVAGVTVVATRWVEGQLANRGKDETATWFAPYVDATLIPTHHFEDPDEQPADEVVLGFVVADPGAPCRPSWGGYYSLDAAGRALDLDRRLVRLRERGGEAIISFGGALNHELATVCGDPDSLLQAYESVLRRYEVTVIDFDVEGLSLADEAANGRRAAALSRLQAANPHLEIWFTLPVSPDGLTAEGVALVDGVLAAGVDLGGVNVMTMNFGSSRGPSTSLYDATVTALLATWQQLDGAFRRSGLTLSQAQTWSRLGATPMIGRNDVPADVFRPSDATRLRDYAAGVGLGRLSMWSANRDRPCGAAVSDARVSNTCSGVDQELLEFTRELAAGAPRHSLTADASPAALEGAAARLAALSLNDPRTSPYPLWRDARAYEEGAKIVWQGRVYEAKWWSQGDQPDAPVKHVWETPWRYLGPVLESDRTAVLLAEPPPGGPRPNWSAEQIYVAGDEVAYGNQAFLAKWWTQGVLPLEDPDQPYDHPWEYLGVIDPNRR